MAIKFFDTNALLELGERVLEEDKFYVSSVTLEELEHIKTSKNKDEDVKYKARRIVHILDEHQDKVDLVPYNYDAMKILERVGLEETPDNKICACAVIVDYPENSIVFVTNDIACKLIAKNIFHLNVESVKYDNKDRYTGFKEVIMSDEDMAYFYEHLTENKYDLLVNEYIVVKNESGEPVDALKWTGETHVCIGTKPYKSAMLGTLKPLDIIQRCAMDSINNNEITVLYGRAGSGKTIIPLSYIMQQIEKGKLSKCYIVYSYEPLKNAKVLGFEKGSHEDKLLLSASIGNILASKFGDIEEVRYMLDRGTIDIIPTANIRGVEFEADSCCYVTESQNLDVYTLKTIVQRCKSGCKQIYEGDIIEQKDTNIQNTGIDRLIEVFKGNEKFGCVKLKKNYRNKLSELADLM